MLSLLRRLASWSVRHIFIFALIVVAMAAFVVLKQEYDRRPVIEAEVAMLEEQQRLLDQNVREQRERALAALAEIERLERPALLARLRTIRSEKARLDVPRLSQTGIAADLLRNDSGAIARELGANFRLQLLHREEAVILGRLAMIERRNRLIGLNGAIERTSAEIARRQREIAALERRYPLLARAGDVPVLPRFIGPLRELQANREALAAARKRRADLIVARQAAQAGFVRARDAYRDYRAGMAAAEAPVGRLGEAVAAKREELSRNWATMAWDAIRPVLGWALWVMAALILIPPAVKAFWFFVIAPIAARLDPVRIRPDLRGDIGWAAKMPSGSAVSRSVVVRPGDELLIKPEYLQSSMNEARIDTGVVLNRKFLFSSLAAGLAGLTRIRVDREASATLSATRDLVDEVGIIQIGEGSAMVFQPRNLVGVLQRGDRPLRIESVWRLGHLSAWLTLQLRFLVFHGPCALVVKGARGVALEPAPGGRRIAGAATMGWSAGLAYSVRRSETFFAYLTGKQSLFNDSFEGADGRIVYEQLPRAGARGGFWGRGLEGLGDGLLKIFGL